MTYRPVDEAAERAVLAGALTSADVLDRAVEQLDPSDFGVEAHRAIFAAVVAVESAGKPVDHITVCDELRKRRQLSRAGGSKYVEELAAEARGVADPEAHIEIVLDRSTRRRIVDAGHRMASTAMRDDVPADDALEAAEQAVYDIGRRRSELSLVTMTQAVAETMREIQSSRTRMLLGDSTGIPSLDKVTAGLQPGHLVVIAARPGMGKSSLAIQIAAHMAATTAKTVPFLSYEMSRSEIVVKLLAQKLRYSGHRLRQGDIPPDMERDVAVAAEHLAGLPMLIDDSPPATVAGVRSMVRRLSRRGEVGAVFVDYLQLLESDRRGRDPNRTQEVSEIARGLKRLATELHIPVVAVSQLNRSLESRQNKRPQLSDLRESGEIEQAANLILCLYREWMYNAAADPSTLELIVAKQRSGPAGISLRLRWDPESTLTSDPQEKAVVTDRGAAPF